MVGTLAEYSLGLLRERMLTQLVAGAGGMSLTEYILGKPRPERRDCASEQGDAVRGLMRGDSATLRAASKCMLLAKALLEAGGESIGLILINIRRMNAIAAELMRGGVNRASLKAEYATLAARIKFIIEGSRFEEVSLLDGEAWPDDERIAVNGDIGRLSLKGSGQGQELTLYDLKDYKEAFQASDLEQEVLPATAAGLGQFSTMLEGMASSYKARAGLLDAEAAGLERRADILDEAWATAAPGSETSLQETLVGILMRDGNSILSGMS